MQLKVIRNIFTPLSTMGNLFIDGEHFCVTLEPPVKTDGSKPRAIPDGTYPVTLRWSDKFRRNMPHVENVPGFQAVEIHWGNIPKDTEACLMVGASGGINVIFQSRDAFDRLYPKLIAASGIIHITYESAAQAVPASVNATSASAAPGVNAASVSAPSAAIAEASSPAEDDGA